MKGMIRVLLFFFGFVVCIADVSAQVVMPNLQTEKKDKGMLNHLDFSATVGTMGLGFDFAMPVGNYVKVRAGGTWMPHFRVNVKYELLMSEASSRQESREKFDKAAQLLKQLTNREAQRDISMMVEPNSNNFKFLVDFFPLRNKNWHVTAGFYWGNSTFAKAINRTEDMTNLVMVNLYNHIVDKILAGEDIATFEGESISIPEQLVDKVKSYGYMSVFMGPWLKDEYDSEGNLIHQKGDAYYLRPSDDNMVRCNAVVNKFKPYVGIGYSTTFKKGGDTSISIDAGALFWGGRPSLITHEGIDIMHSVGKNGGDVEKTVNFIKKFPVYPVVEIKLTQRIF